MSNNGKIFEAAIAAIQEAFKDIPSGKILQNVKLEDISGVLREIDVLVKLPVQGTEINIAIECKDHKRKVSILTIDGFHGKCLDIPLIDKKILISRKGFSKSARLKAKRCGILLLVLEEVTSESIKKWLHGATVTGKVNIARTISSLSVEFVDKPFEILGDETFIEFDRKKIPLTEFIRSFINENIYQIPYAVRSEDMPKNRVEVRTVGINFPETCLVFCRGESGSIKNLWFDIKDSFSEMESKLSYDRMMLDPTLGIDAEVLTITLEDDEVMSLVKKSSSDRIDMIVSQINSSGEKIYIKVGEMNVSKTN